jgi:conjugal transfer pilus assembly protein TraV
MSGRRLWGVGALGLLVTAAGCVNMSGLGGSSQYTCAAPDGVTCDSVSGTYANAVRHNLPSQHRTSGPADRGSQPAAPASAPAAPPRPQPAASSGSKASALLAEAASSLRTQARVLRLWVKPWEDADGDLFDQAHVYVQVDGGHWQIEHVRQRIRNEFAPLRAPAAATTPGPAGLRCRCQA